MKKNLFKKVLATVASLAMVATMMPGLAQTAKAADSTVTLNIVDNSGSVSGSLEYSVAVAQGGTLDGDGTGTSHTITVTDGETNALNINVTVKTGSGWVFSVTHANNIRFGTDTNKGSATKTDLGSATVSIATGVEGTDYTQVVPIETSAAVTANGTITLTLGTSFLTKSTATTTETKFFVVIPENKNGVTYTLESGISGVAVEKSDAKNSAGQVYNVTKTTTDPAKFNLKVALANGYAWCAEDLSDKTPNITSSGVFTVNATNKLTAEDDEKGSLTYVLTEGSSALADDDTVVVTLSTDATVAGSFATEISAGADEAFVVAQGTNETAGAFVAGNGGADEGFTIVWNGTGIEEEDYEVKIDPTKADPFGIMSLSAKAREATFKVVAKTNYTARNAKVYYRTYQNDPGIDTIDTKWAPAERETGAHQGEAVKQSDGTYVIPDIQQWKGVNYVVISVVGVEPFTAVGTSWAYDEELYDIERIAPTKDDEHGELSNYAETGTKNRYPGDEVEFELILDKNAVKMDNFRVYYEYTDAKGVKHEAAKGDEVEIKEDAASGTYKFTIRDDVASGDVIEIFVEGLRNSADYEITFPASGSMMDMGFDVTLSTNAADLKTNMSNIGRLKRTIKSRSMDIRLTESNINEVVQADEGFAADATEAKIIQALRKYEQTKLIYDANAKSEIGFTFSYSTDSAVEDVDGVKATFAGTDITLTRDQVGKIVTYTGRFVPTKSGEIVISGLTPYVWVELVSSAGVNIEADAATLAKAKETRKNASGLIDEVFIAVGEKFVVTATPKNGYRLGSDYKTMLAKDNVLIADSELDKESEGVYSFTVAAGVTDAWIVYGTGSLQDASGQRVLTFKDEVPGSWYVDAVEWTASALGAVGVDNVPNYGIGRPITRGEAVRLLYASAGEPEVSGTSNFPDVNAARFYATPVAWASANGYVSGYPDGTFKPEGNITRAEAVTIINKLLGGGTGTKTFPDVESGRWYFTYVAWAGSNGIVAGYPDGTFRPNNDITREEYAQVLYNMSKVAE